MSWVVGIDEAGRGPLAGPVAVGLIRAPESFDILAAFPGLNDSKKLTEKARERLFVLLEERVNAGDISYSVELRSAEDIDTKGIAVVIRDSIKSGLEALCDEEDKETKIWLDGSLSAPVHYTQETVIKGDSLIPSIMLASIAAKVTRDRLMCGVDAQYPQYGFAKHKGYGTKSHMDALRVHGLSDMHRKTFIHFV
ncbi:MAG: rnhB [Parcubacteria group bacterium]|nr:rnhB [Parcubacteria group bacterium]